MEVLVDSSVLLDVLIDRSDWFDWSAETLATCAERAVLAINPLIYAEVSVRFASIEELDAALPVSGFQRLPLPWSAGFLAGRCFREYRQRGGTRTSPMPDFYIGAHAVLTGMSLLTRDATRYRTYFPNLKLITPDA